MDRKRLMIDRKLQESDVSNRKSDIRASKVQFAAKLVTDCATKVRTLSTVPGFPDTLTVSVPAAVKLAAAISRAARARLLAFVGFALSLGNWAALLVILLPIGAAFICRMNVEEEALSRALGPRYAEYMKRTKRLVPFIY